ncbi:MAG: ABC transporter substrate-binding protein [Halobacteriota archaeon]
MSSTLRPGRRAFVAGAAATLAGCSRVRHVVDAPSSSPVSLNIKTTPADDDPYATKIARHLEQNLKAVGLQAEVIPMTTDELLRSLLIDHEFDLYVARHPGGHDPDFLRALVHSRFGSEPGWQNPFGFADLGVDDDVDTQRQQPPDDRQEVLSDLQWTLAREQPFTVVARPDTIHAVRTDNVDDWPDGGIQSPTDLLSVSTRDGETVEQLTITTTDPRPTRNRNPLSVAFRDRGLVTGLLYDSLARWVGDRLRPWLAESWHWSDASDAVATVELRREATWHDGRSVTAADVAFTYRFLADTTLGEGDVRVPTPRFRGQVDLVKRVTVVDDHTVRFVFDGHPRVARRAFTVPVLPAHEWKPRAHETGLAGIELSDGTTEALVWDNPEPVGSGPLKFERAVAKETLILSRFDDHVLNRDGEGVAYEQLVFRVTPSDDAAVELVAAEEADATGPVFAGVAPRIARAGDLSLLASPMRAFYHVGYNTRSAPLNNPRFRLAIGALLDRNTLVGDAFGGYATPAVSPVVGEWLAPGLEWNGASPVTSFVGGDGTLDIEDAKAAFREAGYRYRNDGTLVN